MKRFSSLISLGILFLTIIALHSCGGGAAETAGKCQTSPVAVFAGIDSLEQHSFEATGQDAIERVYVPQLNINIELFQSGCQFITQEFRFQIHEAYPLNTPAEVCAMHIAGIFMQLSKLDAKLALLEQFAFALKTDAKNFKYNEKLLLQGSDMHVQIDKTHQSESAMLTIIFSQ